MNKQKDYPLNEVQKFSSIKEMLEIAVKEVPNKVAFKYKVDKEVRDVTYSEFQNDTLCLGEALTDLNVENKHIAVIGENSYNWVTVYLTVLKSSGVIVPIDKELPFHDIMNVLISSDSEVAVTSDALREGDTVLVKKAVAKQTGNHIGPMH